MALSLERFKNSDTYKVKFFHPKVPMVEGWLKSPPTVTTASHWGDMASQMFGGGNLDTAAQMMSGRSMTMGQFTVQKWQGQEPIMVTFNVGYVAIYDAFEEVVKPVRELMKFPLTPEFKTAMMIAPADAFHNQTCTIKAKWFRMAEMLPVNVTPEWSHTQDSTGRPISATVSLTFQGARALSMQDIDGWFM